MNFQFENQLAIHFNITQVGFLLTLVIRIYELVIIKYELLNPKLKLEIN